MRNSQKLFLTARTGDKARIYCCTQISNSSCSPLSIKPSLSTSADSKASQVEHRAHAGDRFWQSGYCSSGFCFSTGTVNYHYYREVSQHRWEQTHHKLPAQRQKQNWFGLQWELAGIHCLFSAVIFGCLNKHGCDHPPFLSMLWHFVITFSFFG